MSARDFDLLARYWRAEPWGAWRDNMHAAIIAREVRRPNMKNQRKNLLSDFMIEDPAVRAEEGQKKVAGLFSLFKTVATRVHASSVKPTKRRNASQRKPIQPIGPNGARAPHRIKP